MTGQFPAACAGTQVEVALYRRGPAAAQNPRDELGSVRGCRCCRRWCRSPPRCCCRRCCHRNCATDSLGVSDACLDHVVFFGGGPVYLALDDGIENKRFAGTFVIPAATLDTATNTANGETPAKLLGTVTAIADGVPCTTFDLADPSLRDAAVNARIHVGGASQPAACSRRGRDHRLRDSAGPHLVRNPDAHHRRLATVCEPRAAAHINGPPGTPATPAASPTATPAAPEGLTVERHGQLLDANNYPLPPDQRHFTAFVTWQVPPGFNGVYQLERQTNYYYSDVVPPYGQVAELPASAATKGILTFEEPVEVALRYCYRVRAVDASGPGPYSASDCTVTPPTSGAGRHATTNLGLPIEHANRHHRRR